jgi:hypothetical protein
MALYRTLLRQRVTFFFSFQATLVYYFSENRFCLPLHKAELLLHHKMEKLPSTNTRRRWRERDTPTLSIRSNKSKTMHINFSYPNPNKEFFFSVFKSLLCTLFFKEQPSSAFTQDGEANGTSSTWSRTTLTFWMIKDNAYNSPLRTDLCSQAMSRTPWPLAGTYKEREKASNQKRPKGKEE